MPDPARYAAVLIEETNLLRQARGLPVLTESTCAADAARQRAQALVGAESLKHAPMAGVIAHCHPATTAAENLSRMATGPAAVIEAWMGSASHRSNLLDPGLTEIGISCVADQGATLCSQVFLGP